ncbi:MAG TPA: class I SAM-dependent methyltransferase [Halalkalibaculum sp.]|nr:class I SAM-dependent methyltransferase [Halalkalibaculum sp.]
MRPKDKAHLSRIRKYYKYHSVIYDATRWSFLFGRKRLLSNLPDLKPSPRILEIGCGTGKNIQLLESLYPDATIVGIDLSEDMLEKAGQKVEESKQVNLIHCRYGTEPHGRDPFDLILLSYSLTMIGDSIEKILQQVHEDLNPDGYVGVVDFHNTPFNWFRRWMSKNHVKINGTLPSLLRKYFTEQRYAVKKAYLGFWEYFTFIGRRS